MTAKLSSERRITAQYKALAEHRDRQINELHLLISDHNKRVEADEVRLRQIQQQEEELDNYSKTEMASPERVCLDRPDIERLRGVWGVTPNTGSR